MAEEIKAKGKKAHAYTCDCSKREEIYSVAEKVMRITKDCKFLLACLCSALPVWICVCYCS